MRGPSSPARPYPFVRVPSVELSELEDMVLTQSPGPARASPHPSNLPRSPGRGRASPAVDRVSRQSTLGEAGRTSSMADLEDYVLASESPSPHGRVTTRLSNYEDLLDDIEALEEDT